MLATAIIIGRLGKDPELVYTTSGKAITTMSIAVSNFAGGQQQKTDWYRVKAWEKNAEIAAKYLRKSFICGIQGRLTVAEWQDKKTGEKKSMVEIMAEKIILLDPRKVNEDAGPPLSTPTLNGGQMSETQNPYDGPSFDDIPF